MDLTMTNNFGFCELNEQEMMMVDGGVDGWGIASGILNILGGVCALAASTGADIVTCGVTIPASTVAKASAVCWIAGGVTGIISACQ
ncbi:MAG: class IIb bacteriocin, lactobin A/cerein 7B family [Oscillospiraceae bacterium]